MMLIVLPVMGHRRVLREDRDPLLAFQVHRVQDPVADVLVLSESARLPQHRVDERRLPVIDMRDDGDVAKVSTCGHADGGESLTG